MFFSGDGRYGKLNLTKKCFCSSNKLFFFYKSEDPNKPRIVVLASAGVVTVNINGTIIHFWLIIPCKGKFVSIKWWKLCRKQVFWGRPCYYWWNINGTWCVKYTNVWMVFSPLVLSLHFLAKIFSLIWTCQKDDTWCTSYRFTQ